MPQSGLYGLRTSPIRKTQRGRRCPLLLRCTGIRKERVNDMIPDDFEKLTDPPDGCASGAAPGGDDPPAERNADAASDALVSIHMEIRALSELTRRLCLRRTARAEKDAVLRAVGWTAFLTPPAILAAAAAVRFISGLTRHLTEFPRYMGTVSYGLAALVIQVTALVPIIYGWVLEARREKRDRAARQPHKADPPVHNRSAADADEIRELERKLMEEFENDYHSDLSTPRKSLSLRRLPDERKRKKDDQ